MIKIGDMVGFEFNGEQHLAIIVDDWGAGYPYGRYTGVLVGGNGDHIPLNPEEVTVLSNKQHLEQWERKKNLKKLLDKAKQTE
jgi:hypothetical protein